MGIGYYLVSHKLKTIFSIGKYPPSEFYTWNKVHIDKLEKAVEIIEEAGKFGLDVRQERQIMKMVQVMRLDPEAELYSEVCLPDDHHDEDHWWNTYERD